jgi:Tat protein translocase TatB subunit
MFNIGPMELLLIAVVAIVFVGPDKLPEALKKFGRFFVQVKRHANDVKGNFDEVLRDAERELELERIRELQKKLQADISAVQVIDAQSENRSPQVPALPASEFDTQGHEIPRPDYTGSHDSDKDPFAQDVLEKAHQGLHSEAALPPPATPADPKKDS